MENKSIIQGVVAGFIIVIVIGGSFLFYRWWQQRLGILEPTPSPLPVASLQPQSTWKPAVLDQLSGNLELQFSPQASGSAVLSYARKLGNVTGTVVVSPEYEDALLGLWYERDGKMEYLAPFRVQKAGILADVTIASGDLGGSLIVGSIGKNVVSPDRIFFQVSLPR